MLQNLNESESELGLRNMKRAQNYDKMPLLQGDYLPLQSGQKESISENAPEECSLSHQLQGRPQIPSDLGSLL